MIAHRLSTVGFAHRIIVIVNGEIVEEGKQEALLLKKEHSINCTRCSSAGRRREER